MSSDLRMPEVAPRVLSERRVVVTDPSGLIGICGMTDGPTPAEVPAMDGRPPFRLVRATKRAVYYEPVLEPTPAAEVAPDLQEQV